MSMFLKDPRRRRVISWRDPRRRMLGLVVLLVGLALVIASLWSR
jgi:hypothetical protein